MKITTVEKGTYVKTTVQNYVPTKEELFYYYSGTHGGYTEYNPYKKTTGVHGVKRVSTKLTPKDSITRIKDE